jgi:hypothetical protein
MAQAAILQRSFALIHSRKSAGDSSSPSGLLYKSEQIQAFAKSKI